MKSPSENFFREIPHRGWRVIGRISEMRTKTQHTVLFIVLSTLFFSYVWHQMGVQNMINTFMQTAYRLLMDTVFLTMAMTTLAGAFGRLLSEFGLNNLFNWVFRYFMKPLYGLPGISFLGAISTFLSENMAIIPFSRDIDFMRHLKASQVPLLCNLGTSFGMGLFIVTMLIGFGYYKEAFVGLFGAFIGSIVSVRLMAFFLSRVSKGDYTPDTQKRLDELIEMAYDAEKVENENASEYRGDIVEIADKRGFIERFLSAIIDGGRYGVDIGLGMIPGVLVICSCLMILLMKMPVDGFTGGAFEGVGLVPYIMNYCRPVMEPVLGLESDAGFGLTVACLGSASAAVSLLQKMNSIGIQLSSHEISVFAAFAILWSGFLATHVAVMDALGFRRFITVAVWSHMIAGGVAGLTANFLYKLLHYWAFI